MKRLVLFVVLAFFFCASYAQKISFSDLTNVWCTIDSTTACCIPRPTVYTKTYYDTTSTAVYNGHTYGILASPVATSLIREADGRVYVVDISDSVERILYDYHLALNDTLRIAYPQDVYVSWVTQIDSTQIGGLWYKVWHFDGMDTSKVIADSLRPFMYNVIEGIGCTNGPYYPAFPYTLANFSQELLCFSNKSHAPSVLSNPVVAYAIASTRSFDNDSTCGLFNSHYAVLPPSNVQNVAGTPVAVTVVPNPSEHNCTIVFSRTISSGNIVITNQLGQVIADFNFTARKELEIGNLLHTAGMYYYHVTTGEGTHFSGKFTRQ